MMKTRDEKAILKVRIISLQNTQAFELHELKQQFELAYDSLKPANIIKTTLQSIVTAPNLKADIINGAIGLGTNYLSNTFLNPKSKNPIKKLLGKGLKMLMKNFV